MTDEYLRGDTPRRLQSSLPIKSAHQQECPLMTLTSISRCCVGVATLGLFNSIIPSTFISRHSAVRKNFPFLHHLLMYLFVSFTTIIYFDSNYPRFSPWEPIQVGSCDFLTCPHHSEDFLISWNKSIFQAHLVLMLESTIHSRSLGSVFMEDEI